MADEDEVMSESLTFRLTPSDLERLDRVSGPISRSLVARAAMMLGVAAFEKNPTRVLSLKPAPRGPRPGKKRKPAK